MLRRPDCRLVPPAALLLCLAVGGWACWLAHPCRAQNEPLVSGPQPGERPGPFTVFVATGEHAGQLHCFVCETASRPAVVVFARGLDEPLDQLMQGINRAVAEHRGRELRSWMVLLGDDHQAMTPELVAWGREHGVGTVPLASFEGDGPPTYHLAQEAHVTVILYRDERVVHNFAFNRGDLTGDAVDAVLAAVPDLLQ